MTTEPTPAEEDAGMKPPLFVWAEEGGIELKLTQVKGNRIIVEIVQRSSVEKVLAKATMASFRWERIAEYFQAEKDVPHPKAVTDD